MQLIRSLKDELVEMKKKAVANQKLMLDISHVSLTSSTDSSLCKECSIIDKYVRHDGAIMSPKHHS